MLPGPGSCVIFIYSPLLDALTVYPHLPLAPIFFSLPVFFLSSFICLYLSIDLCLCPVVSCVWPEWWASVYCVKSFIRRWGGVFWASVVRLLLLHPVAEQRPVQLQVTPLACSRRCVWTGNFLATLWKPFGYWDEVITESSGILCKIKKYLWNFCFLLLEFQLWMCNNVFFIQKLGLVLLELDCLS